MKLLIAALLVGSSVASFAQSLSGVQGNVSVTSGGSTSKAGGDTVLKAGDIVTASSGASTVVQVGSCSVPLSAGQSLVVNPALPCDQLTASVKTITVPGSSFVSNFPGGPIGLGASVVAGGLVINKLVKKDDATNVITIVPAVPTTPVTVTKPTNPSKS